ncbi:MAG: hypothetical protein HY925_15860, partial [Elusimicrobia bacterium]|nr:hypothetical protein [Elusimicrobiota bacterium]
MGIDQQDIAQIVSEVLKRINAPEAGAFSPLPPASSSASGPVVFATVDQAVQAAAAAQRTFQALGLEKRR